MFNLTAILWTVSGISSGGYFASQLHISCSSIIKGAAIFAAGPYMCARNSLLIAETECMSLYKPRIEDSIEITNTYHIENKIDDPVHLQTSRVFLFSGTDDTVVAPYVVQSAEIYYQHFIPKTQIHTEYTIQGEHCLPTQSYGEPCNILSSPYLGKCNYDGAAKALHILYDNNITIIPYTNNRLFQFNQRLYTKDPTIDDIGYIYIPEECERTACKTHISFHGCKQGREYIGDTYAKHSGFNRFDVIVIYPYVKSSFFNPNGCWDWWGYTNKDYGTRYGVQIQFILNIIKSFSLS